MKISENILFAIASRMYRSSLGQSEEMAQALVDDDSYAGYRRECLNKVLDAAHRHDVEFKGKDVLDLGCYDGAISSGYLDAGAARVYGVDIDEPAVKMAQSRFTDPRLDFRVSGVTGLPLGDQSVDTVFCYDVFEHVENPTPILEECHRVLRPGGKMLIGTWGWYHPFAPHLWSTMPVPWAHVLFSEKTVLRTCRRVYHSDWYVPNMHDFDETGTRKADKYTHESIPTDYLNKYLISDFQKVFEDSSLDFKINQERFSSKWAAWTTPLLKVPVLKEFFTAYIWVVLERSVVAKKRKPEKQKRQLVPA